MLARREEGVGGPARLADVLAARLQQIGEILDEHRSGAEYQKKDIRGWTGAGGTSRALRSAMEVGAGLGELFLLRVSLTDYDLTVAVQIARE